MEEFWRNSSHYSLLFSLSSWNGKWKVETKPHLFPSWGKPSFKLCSITYDVLLLYNGTIITLIFQMRKLRLQETWGFKLQHTLLESYILYLAHTESEPNVADLNLPFPSHTASRIIFLTLVKSMSLNSQNHPHPTSQHSERLIFSYKVTHLKITVLSSFVFIIPPFNRFFCHTSFPGFWLCC